MKLYQIGSFPPPYGGVSNHLFRLYYVLKCHKINFVCYDISKVQNKKKKIKEIQIISFPRIFIKLMFSKKGVLHFHDYQFRIMILILILSYRHFIILSFHNERFVEYVNSLSWFKKYFYLHTVNKLDKIIVDNRRNEKMAKNFFFNSSNIQFLPEFIPPVSVPELNGPFLKQSIKKKQTNSFIKCISNFLS